MGGSVSLSSASLCGDVDSQTRSASSSQLPTGGYLQTSSLQTTMGVNPRSASISQSSSAGSHTRLAPGSLSPTSPTGGYSQPRSASIPQPSASYSNPHTPSLLERTNEDINRGGDRGRGRRGGRGRGGRGRGRGYRRGRGRGQGRGRGRGRGRGGQDQFQEQGMDSDEEKVVQDFSEGLTFAEKLENPTSKLAKKFVFWQWLNNDSEWVTYEATVSDKIHHAYLANKAEFRLENITTDEGKVFDYEINFNTMQQYNLTTDVKRRVRFVRFLKQQVTTVSRSLSDFFMTLSSSSNPSFYRKTVKFTVSLKNSTRDRLRANIRFSDGDITLADVPLDESGCAIYETKNFLYPSHQITASCGALRIVLTQTILHAPLVHVVDEKDQKAKEVLDIFRKKLPDAKIIHFFWFNDRDKSTQYDALKREFKGRLRGNINEKRLWHGTNRSSVDKILREGFNRDYCSSSTVVYGNGVYFARDADYSYNYTKEESHKIRRLLYCQVLVGDTYRGQSGDTGRKEKPGGDYYDSRVNSLTDPSIFVTCRDGQAIPLALVEFMDSLP